MGEFEMSDMKPAVVIEIERQASIIKDLARQIIVLEKAERRFQAAKAAMQGLIANHPEDYDMGVHEVVSDAVLYADALLSKLEESK